jgi:manganese/iron transport system substrate-binding protein
VLVVNGAGLEVFLDDLLQNAGRDKLVIEASAGLTSRIPSELEPINDIHGPDEEDHADDEDHEGNGHGEGHPHFWLDPNHVIQYVANIRDGLSQADTQGASIYAENAELYTGQLRELDAWIREQVDQIPPERRLLVTNHESMGYYADRYGFRIVGTIIPSLSTAAAPSAQEMAALVDAIRETRAPAIFLETGANPRLAEQVVGETGVVLAPELYSHSLTGPNGPAPNYIEMMKYNTRVIVEALK